MYMSSSGSSISRANFYLLLLNLLILFVFFIAFFNRDNLYKYSTSNGSSSRSSSSDDKKANDNKKNLREGDLDNNINNNNNGQANAKPFDSSNIIPLQNAHSFKDNLQNRPLFDALEYGFCSFGVDVYYSSNKNNLFIKVTDDNKSLTEEDRYSLKNVYLKPLLDFINKKDRPVVFDKSITLGICKQISLFINFDKNAQQESWLALETLLHDKSFAVKSTGSPLFHQYDFINGGKDAMKGMIDENGNDMERMTEDEPFSAPVRIVVSGINDINTLSDYAVSTLKEKKWSRMTSFEGLGSDVLEWNERTNPNVLRFQQYAGQEYRSFFQWPGMKGHMEVRAQIRVYKKEMMAHNLPVRISGSPDDVELWDIMVEESVDVIATQKIEMLKDYLFSYKSKKLPM